MLSFAEEIYLLALDDVTGKISNYSDQVSLSYALIGAVLCELSFIGKIDTDLEKLIVLNSEPTGNKVLDSIFNILSENKEKLPVSYWLKILLSNSGATEDMVLELLIQKGILKKIDEKIFWVFHTRRYPIIDDREIKSVEERIKHLVLDDTDFPDPREAVLVSLIKASNLFETILSPKELKRAEKRIQSLAKIDLIGREVVNMINEIRNFSPSIFCTTSV
ncbi:MAG TPA: phosphoprotein [Lentisphaeria bacterium]|nr:MAG: hypothetical protein A2X47_12630 [Lentisphaerae bacterium GWF2_38_69]HBM15105.1 phosphoprotein [Lentisphaeria bacterium]